MVPLATMAAMGNERLSPDPNVLNMMHGASLLSFSSTHMDVGHSSSLTGDCHKHLSFQDPKGFSSFQSCSLLTDKHEI